MIDLKRVVKINPGESIPGNFHVTVRFDEGSQKQIHIATLLREVWNRLDRLEDANRTKVSVVRIEPNLTKYQFTQEAVDAAIKAERDRACRIIRGFGPISLGMVISIKAKNILCDRIRESS